MDTSKTNNLNSEVEPKQVASAVDPWNSSSHEIKTTNELFIKKDNKLERVEPANFKKIGQGGTSTVYLVKKGVYSGYVIKVYNQALLNKRRGELKNKVKRMIALSPESTELKLETGNVPQFNWPIALVENEKGEFCGLVAPYVNFKKDAYDLTSYLLNINLLEEKHQSITERIQVARNLAGAVSTLHKAGHFFVDMKPQNIFVLKETSTVIFVDCDGFSINGGEFPAHHISPGYIAPEELDNRPEQLSLSSEQDHYALALLIFQLLDYGNKPYACRVHDKSLLDDSEEHTSDNRARKGLYAYGLLPKKGLSPRKESIYQYWPNEIRKLLDQAFTAKSGKNRPSAKKWFNSLHKLVTDWSFEKCSEYPERMNHRHFKGTNCFACEVFNDKSTASNNEEQPKSVGSFSKSKKPPVSTNNSKKGFLKQLRSGNYGLAKTYWLYGVCIGTPGSYLIEILEMKTPILVLCFYLLNVWVGVWRAASDYQGLKLWKWSAKILSFVNIPFLIIIMGVILDSILGSGSNL